MLFDTHAHLDSFEAAEWPGVLDRARAAGVMRIAAIGGTAEGKRASADAASRFPGRVVAAVGYEREQAANPPPLSELETLLAAPGTVAVGECGLDYHYSPETAPAQRALFGAMLGLSATRGLPVIVHSREADADTLAMLSDHVRAWPDAARCPGVLHCFTGSAGFADRVLGLGYMISFSGIVTFRNAEPLRAVAAQVPDDRLLLETDTPYLAPVPHRGKKNEPSYLPEVAAVLAKIRNDTVERIAHSTTRNACRFFGLQEELKP